MLLRTILGPAVHLVTLVRPRDDPDLSKDLHIFHNNTEYITYSDVNQNGDHGHCGVDLRTSPCKNQWWVEPNTCGILNDGSTNVSNMHVTRGPQANFSVKFTGSDFIKLIGKREGSAKNNMLAHFEPSKGTPKDSKPEDDTDDQGVIFYQQGLNSDDSFTMTMLYTGQTGDALDLLAIAIDGRGQFLTRSSGGPASSSPTSTTPPPTDHPSVPAPPSPSAATPISSLSPPSPAPPIRPPPTQHSSTPTRGATGSHSTGEVSVVQGSAQTSNPSAQGSPDPQHTRTPDGPPHKTGRGALIGGIIAGVVLFLLVLVVAYHYLRRRLRARRAPSYPFRARGFQFRKEVEHWTDRPISPIVPTSGDWESFAFPPEKDEEGARKVSERRSTLSSRMGIAL